jgi:hypothetical protein
MLHCNDTISGNGEVDRRSKGLLMLIIEVAVALWFAPLAAAGVAVAPATFSDRYRGQMKHWLVG